MISQKKVKSKKIIKNKNKNHLKLRIENKKHPAEKDVFRIIRNSTIIGTYLATGTSE